MAGETKSGSLLTRRRTWHRYQSRHPARRSHRFPEGISFDAAGHAWIVPTAGDELFEFAGPDDSLTRS